MDSTRKDKYVYDCSPTTICGYVTAIVIFLLTLILGIVFLVLTAVGQENTSNNDCDCTDFTPSMGYGLGASLLLEVGMLVIVFVFACIITLTKSDHIEKLFYAFSIFTLGLIILNGLGFFATTIAATVFVGTGGSCRSITSIIVVSLSTVLATIKLLIVSVGVCYVSVQDCNCDRTTSVWHYSFWITFIYFVFESICCILASRFVNEHWYQLLYNKDINKVIPYFLFALTIVQSCSLVN